MHDWVGRKDRQPVTVDAVIHRADGSSVAVRLTNISEEGCGIEGENDFLIGERVQLAIAGVGQLKAQIRWALHDSAGAKFFDETEAKA
ncbi:MAG: PilZ domain-containing protein [Sphingomicrobium sp.]